MEERTGEKATNTKDELSLREFVTSSKRFFMFSKYKKTLLVLIVSGATLGLLYSIIKKPVYEAEMSFILEGSSKSGLEGYSNIAAQFGLNVGMGGSVFQQADNIIAIIKSRNMVTQTLLSKDPVNKNMLLADRFLEFTGQRKKWDDVERLKNFHFTTAAQGSFLQDSILNLLYKDILKQNLDVEKPDKKLDIIIVRTLAKDELFAKLFTETLIDNVISFYTSVQTKKASENVAILRRQTDSVRTLLNTALSGVAVSMDANPNLNPAYQRARVSSQRKMVDVEMNKEILTELVKNLELAEIGLRKETPLVQIIDTPVLPLEKHETNKILALIVGMGVGLLIGIGVVYVKEYY